jgi:hypothetical protein
MVIKQIISLSEILKLEFPKANINLDILPSGIVFLDIVILERLYVFHYHKKSGFGVDEVKEGEGFLTNYQYISHDFDEAKAELYRLLENGV